MNDNLVVGFDTSNNKEFTIGGITLVRPDTWLQVEEHSSEAKWLTNLNMKEVHPQIATVIVPNKKYPYNKGDRVFLHYMAKETEKPIEMDGEVYSCVQAAMVFFTINSDGTITMADNTYLGEQVYTDAPRTASGIYTTPFDKKKEVLKVKLTHIPDRIVNQFWDPVLPADRPHRYRKPGNQVGDIIATCDDYQYILTFEGKEYVRLLDEEIALTFEQDGRQN